MPDLRGESIPWPRSPIVFRGIVIGRNVDTPALGVSRPGRHPALATRQAEGNQSPAGDDLQRLDVHGPLYPGDRLPRPEPLRPVGLSWPPPAQEDVGRCLRTPRRGNQTPLQGVDFPVASPPGDDEPMRWPDLAHFPRFAILPEQPGPQEKLSRPAV